MPMTMSCHHDFHDKIRYTKFPVEIIREISELNPLQSIDFTMEVIVIVSYNTIQLQSLSTAQLAGPSIPVQ